jgi:hypothetical protein
MVPKWDLPIYFEIRFRLCMHVNRPFLTGKISPKSEVKKFQNKTNWNEFLGFSEGNNNTICQISIYSFQCVAINIEGWLKIFLIFGLQPYLAKSSWGFSTNVFYIFIWIIATSPT